ncbi:MAG: EMC3/TMCO1 family protein [Candidatus Thermoplasmatota archaeon]
MDNKGQTSQILMLMLLIFVMFFIFGDPNIRNQIASVINTAFYPLIGFGGQFPVLTIILSGIIVVFLSSFFQNLFMDWKEMAKAQRVTKAFQKEIKKARKGGDTNKVNKLMKKQPQIMKKQTEASSGMMKPMFFLFIFIAPIFIWLRHFLADLDYYYMTVPWADSISLIPPPADKILMQNWLWLYLIFSMVIGQVIRSGMKYLQWSERWKEITNKILPGIR